MEKHESFRRAIWATSKVHKCTKPLSFHHSGRVERTYWFIWRNKLRRIFRQTILYSDFLLYLTVRRPEFKNIPDLLLAIDLQLILDSFIHISPPSPAFYALKWTDQCPTGSIDHQVCYLDIPRIRDHQNDFGYPLMAWMMLNWEIVVDVLSFTRVICNLSLCHYLWRSSTRTYKAGQETGKIHRRVTHSFPMAIGLVEASLFCIVLESILFGKLLIFRHSRHHWGRCILLGVFNVVVAATLYVVVYKRSRAQPVNKIITAVAVLMYIVAFAVSQNPIINYYPLMR